MKCSSTYRIKSKRQLIMTDQTQTNSRMSLINSWSCLLLNFIRNSLVKKNQLLKDGRKLGKFLVIATTKMIQKHKLIQIKKSGLTIQFLLCMWEIRKCKLMTKLKNITKYWERPFLDVINNMTRKETLITCQKVCVLSMKKVMKSTTCLNIIKSELTSLYWTHRRKN